MPFDGNGKWDRLFHWVTQAETDAGVIYAQEVDADTNDICTNGLMNCITRDGTTVRPTADMDWNNQKIINLGKGINGTDAVTLRQMRVGVDSLFQESSEGANNIIKIINFPSYITLTPQDSGLRIFIVMLKRTGNSAKLSIDVKGTSYPVLDMNNNPVLCTTIVNKVIREFVFYRPASPASNIGRFVMIEPFSNYATNNLNNVAAIDTANSCIRDYIEYYVQGMPSIDKAVVDKSVYAIKYHASKIVNISWQYKVVVSGPISNFNVIFKRLFENQSEADRFKLSDNKYCLTSSIADNTHGLGVSIRYYASDTVAASIIGDDNSNDPSLIVNFNLIGKAAS